MDVKPFYIHPDMSATIGFLDGLSLRAAGPFDVILIGGRLVRDKMPPEAGVDTLASRRRNRRMLPANVVSKHLFRIMVVCKL